MPELTVALLGASGLVGSRLQELWSEQYTLLTPAHGALDVLDLAALECFVRESSATTIVNLVAWADVDGAEREAGNTNGLVYRLNVDFPRRLAELAAKYQRHLVHVSTDYVFDGTKSEAPYKEEDPTRAVCWYAETKLLGEVAVLETEGTCVVRIEMPFTAQEHGKSDLVRTFVRRLVQGQSIAGVTDQRITPVLLDDAAHAVRCLVDTQYAGVIHVAPTTWTTPFELAHQLAELLALDKELVQSETFVNFSMTRPAKRPQHSWLDVSHFTDLYGQGILRSVDDELDHWVKQWQSK